MAGGTRRRGPSGRGLTVNVKTARRRKSSSTRWLRRQLNDPYVAEAQRAGYRSRAAFKLLQLDEKFDLLRPGRIVVDLGAAPGGWSQVAAERVLRGGSGRVIAVDIADMDPIDGVEVVKADILTDEGDPQAFEDLRGAVDVVLSDMAPATTGHRATDQLRSSVLAEAALHVARDLLKPGGTLVAKVFQGGAERDLLADLKRDFTQIRHVKPPASRSESPEFYFVATGFRGAT